MRFNGTLKRWHADRGLGFVVAEEGGEELPVHVSEFPRDGSVPAVGEALSFEVEVNRDGKKCAVRVQRQVRALRSQGHGTRSRVQRSSEAPSRSGMRSSVIGLLIVATLAGYGYFRYAGSLGSRQESTGTGYASPAPAPLPAGFRCDGRLHCSQMTSCGEAKLFLKNCPGVLMDGDGDGVPCEQQLCTGIFGS